jgi:hypothetical protein
MKLFFTTLSIILLFLVSTFTASFAQINWTKDTLNNPVLTTGPEGSWDDYVLYPHGILFDGTTYHMWYGGHDGTNVRIGYASSNDGISWEKHPENPILDLGEKGEWDYYWAYRPCVLYKDNTYHMWYSGYDLSTVRIGYATSQDGISWEKNPQNPVLDLGEVGVWDDGHTGAPSVLYMDGKYHMWYEVRKAFFI